MTQKEVLRAYRVALDPTEEQRAALASHAGASRAAYNYHLAAKRDAHRRYNQEVAFATYGEHARLAPAKALVAARESVKKSKTVRIPTYMDTIKLFCADPDNAWFSEVNRYALTSGMKSADNAWHNWRDSVAGVRAGPRVGYPRFHAKGRARDSFTLFHNVKNPTLRPDWGPKPGKNLTKGHRPPSPYRRLVLPKKISGARGSVRLHGNIRQLARRERAGTARIQSVTISRGGRHWYASILAKEIVDIPDTPNRRQRDGGTIGVDVGVHCYAALSTGEIIANPRHVRSAEKRLAKAQRALSRTGWNLLDDERRVIGFSASTPRRGIRKSATQGRLRAQAKLARAHADLAQRRATTQHAFTKRLATGHAVIAIEDLNVVGMTGSARGSAEAPGTNVRAKSGLNRAILDVGFGQLRRQLEYKTSWFGSDLVVINRWEPTSKTCSDCGAVRAKLRLSERDYTCARCGMVLNRDVNAAINISRLGQREHDDACGKRESLNACGGDPGDSSRGSPLKHEGQGREPPATSVEEIGRPSTPVGADS